MADFLTIGVSPAQFAELERELVGIKDGVKKALAGAINKVTAKATTRVKREIKKRVSLKMSSISEAVKTVKTSAKSDPIVGKIRLSDSPRPLIDFPNRRLKKGYSVRIRPGKPSKFPRAFAATMKSGHRGLFGRVKGTDVKPKTKPLVWYGEGGVRQVTHLTVAGYKPPKIGGSGYVSRLPIKELFGPSITAIYANTPGLIEREIETIQLDLRGELLSQVDRFLKRAKVNRPQ